MHYSSLISRLLKTRNARLLAVAGVCLLVVLIASILVFPHFTHAQGGSLSVQYMPDNASSPTNKIQSRLQITNNGSSSVSLSSLTMRYWFTRDTVQTVNVFCDYASIGCGSIKQTAVADANPTSTADYYLEIGFTSGTLAANSNTGKIKIRASKADNSAFDQTNDYSYNGSYASLTDWQNVTLYENDSLIWGTEPGGTGVTATPTSPSSTATPTATGTSTTISTPTPTSTTTGGTTVKTVYVTFYGFPDNSCQTENQHTCNDIAYPKSGGFPTKHDIATEGSGTYDDPVTYAGAGDNNGNGGPVKPGTIIYVPYLEKYFVMEDQCAECTTDWNSGHNWHVDLWMGSNMFNGGNVIINCEDQLTVDNGVPGTGRIIVNPPSNLAVDTTKMFTNGSTDNTGTCTAHTYTYG